MSSVLVQQTPGIRELCRKRLEDTLHDRKFAHELEQNVYLWSLGTVVEKKEKEQKKKKAITTVGAPPEDAHIQYEGKMLQLIHNLRLNKDTLLKQYNPATLVWLNDTLLATGTKYSNLQTEATEHVQKLQRVLEESKHHTTVQEVHVPTTVFLRCRKCKSTNIEFNQKQTRSGDEGMTSFCTCKACGTTWKMG